MLVVWLRLGAINGFLAVGGGVLAAHLLRTRISDHMLTTFETAARYQMYHALALLAVALVSRRSRSVAVAVAGWSFVIGIILFSGSLYALALSNIKWLGAITPFGGVMLLIGWLALALVPLRSRPRFRL